MNEQEYDEISAKGYALGYTVAHENLAKVYRRKAGEAFALGQRQAADLLMETANELDAMAKKERAAYWKEYPLPK